MNDDQNEKGAGQPKPEGDSAGSRSPASPDVADLQAQLADAQAQAAEYLDSWRRSAAEMSNARKRMLREQDEMRATAAARVLERLLPVADDFDRAFGALPQDLSEADQEWVNGFRAIHRKLQALLDSEGVRPIQAAGQIFDPNLHYAVTHEEAEGFKEGQVIAEVAKGYRLGDKVLRPSMVRVARGEGDRG